MFPIICNKQNIYDDFEHVSLLWKRALQQREEARKCVEKQSQHVKEAINLCALLHLHVNNMSAEAQEILKLLSQELQKSLPKS